MTNEISYAFKATAAGRVNIIGEHIDYCGGKVMPAALSLKNTVYVRPNGTDKINLSWTTLPDKVSLDINSLESYKGLKYGNYQAGAALMWKSSGHRVIGCDMLQDCTVPFGGGLSSSAAIEVSTIAALAAVAGEKPDKAEVALSAQKAEREYAGVNCGIMDQYASACGKKGCAMLLDCGTLECEYLPVRLGEYSLVIIDSNKPHNLVESRYNERRAETEEALYILRKKADIASLAQLTTEQFHKLSPLLPQTLKNRLNHVVGECERVRLAKEALLNGNVPLLGALLNKSHHSLSKLYEVTGRELDSLVGAAQNHPDCAGARMTGGGFGGSAISLVKTNVSGQFNEYVAEKYFNETGYVAKFYKAEISEGITVTEL